MLKVSSPGRVGVGVDAAHHHIAADPGRLGRRDQLHGAAEVHRPLALRAAARPGAGGEDDSVGARDGLGDRRVVGLFEVAHHRVAARGADVVRVVGVADQRADLVAALVEQPREPQRDLPVPSCDRHQHARHDTPATMPAVVPSRSWRYHAHRLVFRHLGIPPGTMRPYALPGAARLHELRWRRRLARAPVTDYASHAAAVGVGEIEEPIPCSLCAGRRVQPLFQPRYHVVRCVECGLLYRNPGIRPERLGDLYAGHYSRFLTGDYATDRQRRYRQVMDAFRPLFADGDGRRLLDFGCGAGLFLELAYERGFEGYGVDLSQDAVAKARERPSGAHAWFGAPGDVPEIAAGGFDVVTMWSVLAHLATPVEDLTMLRSLLSDDGALLVLTVNANSLLLKANGDRWSGFTRNHLKFYSPSTLHLLLRRAGFEAVVMRPMPHDIVEAGESPLRAGQDRRLRRAVAEGNRGNMLRAVAFARADGPARWGFSDAVAL